MAKCVYFMMCLLSIHQFRYSEQLEVRNNAKSSDVSPRFRRALVYPKLPNLLLIFGLGTPLQLDRESVIVGVFTKLLYSLPSNSTDYTEPGVYHTRDSRSRWSIYKIFERAASLYGFGGKECLLKAICQAAATPFDTNHSFFSQLVEIFLRPSSTAEEYDEYGDREYRTAELLGERQGDESCHALYPECRRSVLDVFSTLAT